MTRPFRVNVLHVIPSVSEKHGGPTYAIRAFANASKTAGLHVTIATTDDDGDSARFDVPLSQPVERHGVTHFFFRRDFVPYKISFGLRHWLNDNISRFDVAHIHALFSFSSLAAARAARKHHVPYVVRPLGVLNRWGMQNRRPWVKRFSFRLIELPILRHAAAIHYTAEAEGREANSLHPALAGVPSFVIPIPVELPTGANVADEFSHRFPVSAGRKLVLFLSRIDEKKGIEQLLNAFAHVQSVEPQAMLVIAGSGNDHYVRELRRMSEGLGIENAVLWTGFLDRDQKAEALAAASMFVLPSHSENFGIAVAEALMAGVATIITEGVGLADQVRAANAGIVVPSQTDAIASAMEELLKDPQEGRKMAARGQELAKRLFSAATIGASLKAAYEGILSSQ